MPKIRDLTGNKYGLLTVLEKAEERDPKGNIVWKCQCECGNICLRTRDSLERPSKKPKACSIQCQNGIKIGDKFNRLTVIEINPIKGQETEYKCQCDCGNIITTKGYILKKGLTKSCGCYQRERMSKIGKENSNPVDITGQKFGKLTALEPTEQRQNRSIIWKCMCDCGQIHYASVQNLKNGDVTRCSNCYISSKGEEKIAKILSENNISFIHEKTFESCILPSGRKARFDFYVNNQYLIEFDGEQHFNTRGWNTEENYLKIKEHDKIKTQWCKDNNIPLIRIPYIFLDTLTKEDLILDSSKFLIS